MAIKTNDIYTIKSDPTRNFRVDTVAPDGRVRLVEQFEGEDLEGGEVKEIAAKSLPRRYVPNKTVAAPTPRVQTVHLEGPSLKEAIAATTAKNEVTLATVKAATDLPAFDSVQAALAAGELKVIGRDHAGGGIMVDVLERAVPAPAKRPVAPNGPAAKLATANGPVAANVYPYRMGTTDTVELITEGTARIRNINRDPKYLWVRDDSARDVAVALRPIPIGEERKALEAKGRAADNAAEERRLARKAESEKDRHTRIARERAENLARANEARTEAKMAAAPAAKPEKPAKAAPKAAEPKTKKARVTGEGKWNGHSRYRIAIWMSRNGAVKDAIVRGLGAMNFPAMTGSTLDLAVRIGRSKVAIADTDGKIYPLPAELTPAQEAEVRKFLEAK